MTHRQFRSLALAAVLLGACASSAAAQDGAFPPPRTLVPAAFPRWDAGATLGLFAVTTAETDAAWSGWEQKGEFRADAGRYWTTHLKTDIAVSATNSWHDYESEQIAVPGSPVPAFSYIEFERRLYTVAPAVTWQFRENTFMHPYVSGGVKLGLLSEHRSRLGGTYRAGITSYTVPGLDEHDTRVLARPFVAGGFKSYVTRSVFVRTEGRLAFGTDGIRQVSVLAGMGMDF